MTIDKRRGPSRLSQKNGAEKAAAKEVSCASEEAAQFNQTVYLTTEQAPIANGLSPSYWAKQRVVGGGPFFFKYGSCVRYHPGDIAEFVATRRQSSAFQSGKFAKLFLPETTVTREW